jgi:hypothetical protein
VNGDDATAVAFGFARWAGAAARTTAIIRGFSPLSLIIGMKAKLYKHPQRSPGGEITG